MSTDSLGVSADKLLFVVGCPRSGTSPFARWLAACGLSTAQDPRRQERYPAGYFEHLPVLMFHRALEPLPRGADYRVTLEPYLRPELMQDAFVAESFELAFAPLLRREIDFLKYPQLALSIDFLFERFEGMHLIAVWRDPVQTFRSLVTKEFPPDWILSAGFRSFLLWSIYAHHVIEAKRARPDDVTVLEIDALLEDPTAGPKVLERAGRDPESAVPIEEAVDSALWNRRLGLGWRAYHRLTAIACAAVRSRMGPEWAALADQKAWERELRAVSDIARPAEPG